MSRGRAAMTGTTASPRFRFDSRKRHQAGLRHAPRLLPTARGTDAAGVAYGRAFGPLSPWRRRPEAFGHEYTCLARRGRNHLLRNRRILLERVARRAERRH